MSIVKLQNLMHLMLIQKPEILPQPNKPLRIQPSPAPEQPNPQLVPARMNQPNPALYQPNPHLVPAQLSHQQQPNNPSSANSPVVSRILTTAASTTFACGYPSDSTNWNRTVCLAWPTTQPCSGALPIKAHASPVGSPARLQVASPMPRITPSTSGACGTSSAAICSTIRNVHWDKPSMRTVDDAFLHQDHSWYRMKTIPIPNLRDPNRIRNQIRAQ